MSLGSLLSIARSALIVQQRSMEVTGNNIANANTPGYSRQTLELQSAMPLMMPLYSVGRGVEANQITRQRDTFYDAAFRTDSGSLGQSSTLQGYLSQVESSLNEPSTNGLSSSLDGLFNSLSDLANDPTSKVSRDLAVSSGQRVAQQLNSLATAVTRISQQGSDDLKSQIDQVNQYAQQIAELNGKVIASAGPRGASPDLMDQRDVLVDKLSQFMDVRVIPRADGSVSVAAGDTVLVDGTQAGNLMMVRSGSGWGISPSAGGPLIDPQSGSLKALTDLTQTKLPAIQSQLDNLASALVTEFNQVHRTGTTPSGATGLDFFDPTATTASTIRMSSTLLASSDNLATSANGTPGNGDIATKLAGLATASIPELGGSTFRESFVSLAAGVGLQVNNATQDSTTQQTLVDRSDAMRTSVSGVNVDEEMISLISSQQAYSAAARLVTVADQMVQQLMTIGQ